MLNLLNEPLIRAGVILLVATCIALFIHFFIIRWLLYLTRKTATDFDDRLAQAIRRPIFISVLLVGIYWSLKGLIAEQNATASSIIWWQLKPSSTFVIYGFMKTIAIYIWAKAGMSIGSLILSTASKHAHRVALIQPRTLPLFDIIIKIIIVGSALYFTFLAWHINVTGWLASAGIVGIAVGFAAKDTLANLFAGFFILADAPYKIGDFIILDNGQRGRVTDIGIRSTRILTRDDVEITIPNAVIGNAKIINESGGPYQKARVRVTVSVSYESDIDQVREVLLSCAQEVEHVTQTPEPRVRFREFGDSGLKFQLLVWIDEPVYQGRVLDQLNSKVYKAFKSAGIEIPYSKHDIYIRQASAT